MKKFDKLIEDYNYDNLSEKDKLYLDKVGYEIKDIIAVMDFNESVLYTPNNEYDMNEFDQKFVDFFREFTRFENKQVDKLPLTQEVLDACDELIDSNVIPDIERPKKEEYSSTREAVKLAFHYEMTLLARLEDRVTLSKDQLLHAIETIGTREGIEESEKEFIQTFGTKEAKEELKNEEDLTAVAVVSAVTSEILSETPVFEFGEPVFESDEPVFESDEPVFESDEPVFESDEPVFEMGMF